MTEVSRQDILEHTALLSRERQLEGMREELVTLADRFSRQARRLIDSLSLPAWNLIQTRVTSFRRDYQSAVGYAVLRPVEAHLVDLANLARRADEAINEVLEDETTPRSLPFFKPQLVRFQERLIELDGQLTELLSRQRASVESDRADGGVEFDRESVPISLRLAFEVGPDAESRARRFLLSQVMKATMTADTARISIGRTHEVVHELEDKIRNLERASLEWRQAATEATDAARFLLERQGRLRELLGEVQASEARASFEVRGRVHQREEEINRGYFLLSLFVLAIVVGWTLTTPIADFGTSALLALAARRGLAVLLAALAVRITLRRWNIERHLRILYDHRAASIEQLEKILEGMPAEDAEERSRLRREAAVMFLRDPRTGYLEDQASEISLSPLVTAVDRATSKT